MNYLGVITSKNRYALRRGDGEAMETPQMSMMRIAMGLSYNEPNPTEAALGFYDHMSRLEYSPGGSTRINAGTSFPQLSNCFLMEIQDDMESIAKGIRDVERMKRARRSMDHIREEIRKEHVVLDIGVPAIRELRDA